MITTEQKVFGAASRAAERPGGPASSLGHWAVVAIGLEILLGLGVVGGGIALMAGPHGEILPLPMSGLNGSPFTDYFAPGAILFAVLGIGPLGAAVVAWRRHRAAPLSAFAVGCALLIWMIVEIAVVGYSNHPPLQPPCFGLGIVMTSVGIDWMRQAGAGFPRSRRRESSHSS